MIAQRISRQREYIVLQFLQIMHTRHFLHRVGIAEDKVTKTKVFGKHVFNILIDHLGVLIDESGLALVCIRFLVNLARIEHQRNILIHLTNRTKQFETSKFILLITVGQHGETAITYHTQHIVAKLGIKRPSLFVGTC